VIDHESWEATVTLLAPDTAPPLPALGGAAGAALVELLPSLVAVARAMEGEFDPRRFLDAFSAQLQLVVPHDRVSIVYLDDDRQTFSIFAEHAGPGLLPKAEHYTTDFRRESRFRVFDSPLRQVLTGEAMRVDDLSVHPCGLGGQTEDGKSASLRAGLLVPLESDGRQVGAILAARLSTEPYTETHLATLRQISRLIGPLIEHVVLLHRERRRRSRLETLAGLPLIFGTSLDLKDIFQCCLGEAVRPILDFDFMGAWLYGSDGRAMEWLATTDNDPTRPAPASRPMKEFSFAVRVPAGEVLLYRDVRIELDPAFPGDRMIIERGGRSMLGVPLRFGGNVGGALAFGKRQPEWYDATDVEVATGIAAQVVLAIQHQRLAEEQRRAAVAVEQAGKLKQRLASLRAEVGERYGFQRILGRSPALQAALATAEKVASTDTTVLITGESGTGKELVARAIHYASLRADGPFQAINCAALPETLLESELFGHERGAFTGADRQKVGRFELATGGTLFLDEVGELSSAVQAKFLRVIQEREFQRLGGTVTLRADVRILAATNKSLEQAVAAGGFREDLLYRLNVFPIHLPPLRDRGEDILLLAEHFVRELAPKLGKVHVGISPDARAALLAHTWPGNIREVQNAVERALIMSDGRLITAAQLGLPSPGTRPTEGGAAPTPHAESAVIAGSLPDMEKRLVREALERTKGNKTQAAKLLGLTRIQLYTRLKRFGIE
jgi:transcriptional regulator with GAF, ATPase, and Fis domain